MCKSVFIEVQAIFFLYLFEFVVISIFSSRCLSRGPPASSRWLTLVFWTQTPRWSFTPSGLSRILPNTSPKQLTPRSQSQGLEKKKTYLLVDLDKRISRYNHINQTFSPNGLSKMILRWNQRPQPGLKVVNFPNFCLSSDWRTWRLLFGLTSWSRPTSSCWTNTPTPTSGRLFATVWPRLDRACLPSCRSRSGSLASRTCWASARAPTGCITPRTMLRRSELDSRDLAGAGQGAVFRLDNKT